MKIDLSELKKAVAWVEANTGAINVDVMIDSSKFYIKTFDKHDRAVEIKIFDKKIGSFAELKRSERLK